MTEVHFSAALSQKTHLKFLRLAEAAGLSQVATIDQLIDFATILHERGLRFGRPCTLIVEQEERGRKFRTLIRFSGVLKP